MDKQTEKDREIFKIKTTSFPAEDFYLDTTLTPEEIKAVLSTMKQEEMEDEQIFYDNEDYTQALERHYPDDIVNMWSSFQEVII
jgi:hypothetical protein